MSFASRLRQAREQSGITQQDLAEKLGVTKSAVGNYENGVSSPKWDVLLKIFDVLQVEPNFLYQDSFSSELSGAVQLTPAGIPKGSVPLPVFGYFLCCVSTAPVRCSPRPPLPQACRAFLFLPPPSSLPSCAFPRLGRGVFNTEKLIRRDPQSLANRDNII